MAKHTTTAGSPGSNPKSFHAQVTNWNRVYLPKFAAATINGNISDVDDIEQSLEVLAASLYTGAGLAARDHQKLNRGEVPPKYEQKIEDDVIDINRALAKLVSLRPPGAKCPIRTYISRSIDLLTQNGGFRPEEW